MHGVHRTALFTLLRLRVPFRLPLINPPLVPSSRMTYSKYRPSNTGTMRGEWLFFIQRSKASAAATPSLSLTGFRPQVKPDISGMWSLSGYRRRTAN